MENDLPVIDIGSLKLYADTQEEMREFIDIFVAQSIPDLQKLKDNCTAGENRTWVETSHKLKGGAGTIGAMRMRHLCSEAQSMADADADSRQAMYNRIHQAFDDACAELKKIAS